MLDSFGKKKCSSKFKTEWLSFSELVYIETELDDEDKVIQRYGLEVNIDRVYQLLLWSSQKDRRQKL